MNHFKAAGRCSTTQHNDNIAASHTPIPDKEDQEIFEGNHIHAGAKSYGTAGEDKKVGGKTYKVQHCYRTGAAGSEESNNRQESRKCGIVQRQWQLDQRNPTIDRRTTGAALYKTVAAGSEESNN